MYVMSETGQMTENKYCIGQDGGAEKRGQGSGRDRPFPFPFNITLGVLVKCIHNCTYLFIYCTGQDRT